MVNFIFKRITILVIGLVLQYNRLINQGIRNYILPESIPHIVIWYHICGAGQIRSILLIFERLCYIKKQYERPMAFITTTTGRRNSTVGGLRKAPAGTRIRRYCHEWTGPEVSVARATFPFTETDSGRGQENYYGSFRETSTFLQEERYDQAL